MKRIITALALIAVSSALCACSVQRIDTERPADSTTPKATSTANVNTDSPVITDSASSEAPETPDTQKSFPAALYNMTHSEPGVREDYAITSRYEDDMSQGRDLCVLGAFPASETALSGKNMGEIWSACLRQNDLSDELRPGFLLEFDTPEGHCTKLILRPRDITDAYWDYIETYIYDDIHQTPGAWYSHLLDSEFTDETIVTSVKITAGEKIAEVSDLTLTVFMYNIGDISTIDDAYARANGFACEIIPNPARK